MLHIGQKMVCIGGEGTPKPPGWWDEWAAEWGVTRPTRGEVYTVRDIKARKKGGFRIRLVEIVNPPVLMRGAPQQEPWFWAEMFRPVVEKKTNISAFEEILKRETVDDRAPASVR